MPTMSLFDYRNKLEDSQNWVIYSNHIADNVFTTSVVSKNFYLCEMKTLYFNKVRIKSIFEKCDLTNTRFIECFIDKEATFIDCNFKYTKFECCAFASEELLIFLKMSGAKIIRCSVEGKNGTENWNV